MKNGLIKLAALLMTAAMLLSLTACATKGDDEAVSNTDSGNMDSAGNTETGMDPDDLTPIEEPMRGEDITGAASNGSGTTIVLDGDTARITGAGAVFSTGTRTLTIKQPGTYTLSGSLANGQVLIETSKDDMVRLVLGGVTLHNETGPAIYAKKTDRLELALENGTKNTVSDGAKYAAASDANEPDAAIFVQDGLSISGNGSLIVTGRHKHGIRAQDYLTITGGMLNVTAAGDALRGRDGVTIQDGSFTLKAGGDGIQSNNDKDAARGFVTINGGTFAIEAGNDGIQAHTTLKITGGKFNIKTGGGSANAPQQESNFRGRPGMAQSADNESESMKALKAGKHIQIAGGDFTIDAEDDAVHSNDTITMTAGKFNIKTGDDGFHADAALEISGGEIDIASCYEGIEGLAVTISGGNISVVSRDDAVNAAGGADSGSDRGGPMGRDRFAANGDIFLRISGGTIDLYARGDGIDSNNNIFLEGGTIKISGPSQGMEGAIDYDGVMTVTGGKLITAGSVMGASQDSTQPVLLVSYSSQLASGSVIAIKDAKGNALLEYTSKTSFYMSGFTSPSFKIGETYSLFINGQKRTDIKLSGVVTSIGDTGGAYSGGMGGRGGQPGRRG